LEGLSNEHLRVTVERLRDHALVIPVGEIDIESSDVFRDALERCDGDVVVDLSSVPFIGSAGIGVIVGQRKRLEAAGGALRLRSPRAVTRRAFEAVGLGHWIE
jgi:anti-anti-sigma factor